MKRILVFLGLKVAEIGGAFGVFALASYRVRILEPEMNYWLAGFIGTLFLIAVLGIILVTSVLGYALVLKNWKWAKRITDK